MGKKKVVIWFLEPPKAEKGAYNYLTENWGADVIYIIDNDLPNYRKERAWDDGGFGKATVIRLWCYKDKDNIIKELCAKYKDDIHILAGFVFNLPKTASKYLIKQKSALGVFTERPTFTGGKLELLLRHIHSWLKYRAIYWKYNKHVDFVLPLGYKALKNFNNYGWPLAKLYNFMYNPNIPDRYVSKPLGENSEVKFVYIGRFCNKTKGVDTLLAACKGLKGKWSLDLIGGYGPHAEITIEEAEKMSNVNYIGSWKANDVIKNLGDYDIAVVPSKYDGWNLLPNEAIHAGIGCIVSNEAVSDELITSSGSGEVFTACKAKELRIIMQKAVNNHNIVNEWKKAASDFVDNISENTVGAYLIAILNHVYGNSNQRPDCPWLKK